MLPGNSSSNSASNSSIPSFSEEFSGIFEEQEQQATLYFNCDNKMIQGMERIGDTEKIRAIVKILYVQSLLSGRYTIGARELSIFNESLEDILVSEF